MALIQHIEYNTAKEVKLTSLRPGQNFLLQIDGKHTVYTYCKIGNSPITVDTSEEQPHKKIVIENMATGRLVPKHPMQKVVPVECSVSVSDIL